MSLRNFVSMILPGSFSLLLLAALLFQIQEFLKSLKPWEIVYKVCCTFPPHISSLFADGRNFVLFSIFCSISVVRVASLLQFVVRTELHNICSAVRLRSYIPPNNRNQVALIVATILEPTLAPLPVHS